MKFTYNLCDLSEDVIQAPVSNSPAKHKMCDHSETYPGDILDFPLILLIRVHSEIRPSPYTHEPAPY